MTGAAIWRRNVRSHFPFLQLKNNPNCKWRFWATMQTNRFLPFWSNFEKSFHLKTWQDRVFRLIWVLIYNLFSRLFFRFQSLSLCLLQRTFLLLFLIKIYSLRSFFLMGFFKFWYIFCYASQSSCVEEVFSKWNASDLDHCSIKIEKYIPFFETRIHQRKFIQIVCGETGNFFHILVHNSNTFPL